jgi:hypothetical protein
MMAEYRATAARSPNWDAAEVRRRLGRAYTIILESAAKARAAEETADRGEFGDLTRPAADDAPAVKPDAQDEL